MTDLAFAKTFLATLDNKPTKFQPDHVFDPKSFEVRVPYVLPKLPHPPHPAPPKDAEPSQAAPGAEKATTTTNTINVTFKSAKNPTMTFTLSGTPPSTTLASLKQQLHNYLGGASVVNIDKIKILLNKKPVPSSKQTVADTVESEAKEIEYGVMVIGGAPDPPPQTTAVTERLPEPAGPGSENAAVEAETGLNPADTTASSGTAMEGVEKSRSYSQSTPVQPGELTGQAVLRTPEFWTDLEGFLSQRIRDHDEAKKWKNVFQVAFESGTSAP